MYNLNVILHMVERKLGTETSVYIDAEELIIDYPTRHGVIRERFDLVENNLDFTESLQKAIQKIKDKLK